MPSKVRGTISLKIELSIICTNSSSRLTTCTVTVYSIGILSLKTFFSAKTTSSLLILDLAEASTASNHTQNTFQRDGTALLNAFLPMVTTDIKWTFGESVVFFLKSYLSFHCSLATTKLIKSTKFTTFLAHPIRRFLITSRNTPLTWNLISQLLKEQESLN